MSISETATNAYATEAAIAQLLATDTSPAPITKEEVARLRCCNHCGLQQDLRRRGAKQKALFKCLGCDDAWYCTTACVMEDWDSHKEQCQHVSNRFLPAAPPHEGRESLMDVLEVEYVLTELDARFRSGEGEEMVLDESLILFELAELDTPFQASEETVLQEAKTVLAILVERCSILDSKDHNYLASKKLVVALLQRMCEDDRRLFKTLCLQDEKAMEREVSSFCGDVMGAVVLSDLAFLSSKRAASQKHCHDKRLNQNSNWFLPFCDAIFEILQAFPEEESFAMPPFCLGCPKAGKVFEKIATAPMISCQRSPLYFRLLWEEHITLCATLLIKVSAKVPVPPNWISLAIKLWHQLVVCMSHSESAKAVLWGADKAFLHFKTKEPSGIKEYFRPLMQLFKPLRDVHIETDTLWQCVYQVAALLVAHSRHLDHGGMASFSTGEAFTLHRAQMENAFVSYMSKDQGRLWNHTFLPWAMAVVEERAGEKKI